MKKNIFIVILFVLPAFANAAVETEQQKKKSQIVYVDLAELIYEGIRLNELQKYDDALKVLQFVVEKWTPETDRRMKALVHYNIALASYYLRDFDSVKSNIDDALEQHSNYFEPRILRARLNIRIKKPTAALEELNYLAGFNETPHLLSLRALAKIMLEMYEEAIVDLDKLLSKGPDPVAFYNRGMANLNLKRYERAVTDFHESVKLQISPQNLNMLAWILATKPNPDGRLALGFAQQALKRSHEMPERHRFVLHGTMAGALACLGRYADAVKYQEQAISNAPAEYKPDLRIRLEAYQEGRPWKLEDEENSN